MEDLIKALQIFLKYGNPKYPTSCGHNVLYVDIDPKKVSDEDKKELERLGFESENCDNPNEFFSFRYG